MEAGINEIFYSIQGEGILTGFPFLFIRFGGCNLNCPYCDTKWSRKTKKHCLVYYYRKKMKIKNPVSISQLKTLIKPYKYDYVSLTGGEPLLQQKFIEGSLNIFKNKKILIETNGTLYDNISETLIKRIDYWSVDIKLPSITKKDCIKELNLFLKGLKKAKYVILKCIFSDEVPASELRLAGMIAKNFYKTNKNLSLIFQPIMKGKKVKIKKSINLVYSIMKNAHFEVRLIPQMHKYLALK